MTAISNSWAPVSAAIDNNAWVRRGLVVLLFAFILYVFIRLR